MLRLESKRVSKELLASSATQKLIDDMMETMVEYIGVGLAAPQVHESLAIAVIESHGPRGPRLRWWRPRTAWLRRLG